VCVVVGRRVIAPARVTSDGAPTRRTLAWLRAVSPRLTSLGPAQRRPDPTSSVELRARIVRAGEVRQFILLDELIPTESAFDRLLDRELDYAAVGWATRSNVSGD
jgi:hypothetical protein